MPHPPLGTQALRLRLFTATGRHRRGGGRRLRLRITMTGRWGSHLTAAIACRLSRPAEHYQTLLRQKGQAQGPWNPAHSARLPGRHP